MGGRWLTLSIWDHWSWHHSVLSDMMAHTRKSERGVECATWEPSMKWNQGNYKKTTKLTRSFGWELLFLIDIDISKRSQQPSHPKKGATDEDLDSENWMFKPWQTNGPELRHDTRNRFQPNKLDVSWFSVIDSSGSKFPMKKPSSSRFQSYGWLRSIPCSWKATSLLGDFHKRVVLWQFDTQKRNKRFVGYWWWQKKTLLKNPTMLCSRKEVE